jgi:hypothetical protein
MPGCVKAFLVLLIFVSQSLMADCTWLPRQSTQFRTTALDLSVDGPFVWLATGYGVQLLEGTRAVDSLAIPSLTRVVQADGSGLAYAGSGARIHVLRRDGRKISLVRSVDAPGTVNDIVLEGGYLFAATTSGIAHYDLLDRTNPVRTSIILHTSAPNVTMLASTRGTLYAADGDATVEKFSIDIPALPQNTGTLEAMPSATAVHTANDNFIYVSDRFGQLTDVFSGNTRVARLPFGATSFAAAADRVHYIAGPDRTIRAVDFTVPDRLAERFEAQLAPTGGTDNAIHALARNGDTLYVAAGDVGLALIDLHTIARPYPLVSYGTGATTSVRVSGDRAWTIDANGIITEHQIDASGIALVPLRSWAAGAGSTIRDVRDNTLLTTNGNAATTWSLAAGAPTASAPVMFPETISNAVLGNTSVLALLANASLYSNQTRITAPPLALLTRNGSAIAATQIRDDGDTVLHHWANGDVTSVARTITIDGAATGNIALDPLRAAVFTFNGISVADLATGSVRTIPDSNEVIPRQLVFDGDDLLALGTRSVFVYTNAETLGREQRLPADAAAFDAASSITVIATNEGVAAVARTGTLPQAMATFANDYYTKVFAAGDSVYLYGGAGIDIFVAAPFRRVTSVRPPGAIDAAATATTLYTLSADGTVSAWSTSGVLLAQASVTEPAGETQPLSIHTVGGAVWVSLSTGCTTGACIRKTVVLDPATLVFATSVDGAIRDVAVAGNRAYALIDQPDALRAFDITQPLQPSEVTTSARPSSATSLAYENGRIHVLGDKLYTYSAASLILQSERFTAITPDDAQRIRIDGDCAIVTGRSEKPELYALPAFVATSAFDVPSPVRSIAVTDGRVFLLTGHSLEVWSTQPLPRPGKRRSVR